MDAAAIEQSWPPCQRRPFRQRRKAKDPDSVIIARSDLRDITGYVRASAQARWLQDHGWKFTVNALGEPVVALAEFNRHMVGGKTIKNQEPNFEGING